MPYQYNFPQQQGAPQLPNSPLKPGYTPQPGMGIMPTAGPQEAPQAGEQSNAEAAQIAALLGTYGDQMELSNLEKQMAAAEALRMGTPEGRSAGRVYVAANPLEHLGKGIGDYKLMKKRKESEAAQKPIRERIGTNVATYGKLALKDL
jgi:hypothetical protein